MNKQSKKLLILIFLATALFSNRVIAKNSITVAAIGSLPEVDFKRLNVKSVKEIISFWKKELKQVVHDKPDLIVLPEYADIPKGLPFSKWGYFLDIRESRIRDFFRSVAVKNDCYLVFGSIRKDDKNDLRNSVVMLGRDGNIKGVYNKNYPTIYEMKAGIKPGSEISVIQCDFGSVGLISCFDLNYGELRRRYSKEDIDLIVFSSSYHGGVIQREWSYSCSSFFVGAIGGKVAPSEIRNPFGEVIKSSTNYFDYAVATINLNAELVHLDYNWNKLEQLKERYGTDVMIYDPGLIGSVLVSSESEDIDVNTMLKEFDIKKMNTYLKESALYRYGNKNEFSKEYQMGDTYKDK